MFHALKLILLLHPFSALDTMNHALTNVEILLFPALSCVSLAVATNHRFRSAAYVSEELTRAVHRTLKGFKDGLPLHKFQKKFKVRKMCGDVCGEEDVCGEGDVCGLSWEGGGSLPQAESLAIPCNTHHNSHLSASGRDRL